MTDLISIYHVSENPNLPKTLEPRIPSAMSLKLGIEDTKTARVCFGPTISHCLAGIAKPLKGKIMYVYEAKAKEGKLYYPDVDEVYDVKITGEIWVLNKINIKKKYKIEVINACFPPATYSVKDRLKYGEAYFWEYKILKEY